MEIKILAKDSLSEQELLSAPLFQDWKSRLAEDWYGKVSILGADVWGGQVHTLQMVVAPDGSPWPSYLTLRSETVDILVLVHDTDEQAAHVVFVEQDRPATGTRVISNVAGGREWDETALESAVRELGEELGLADLNEGIETCVTYLLPNPVLATPGLTNERVHMMRADVRISPDRIGGFLRKLRGKRTGVFAEGEDLTLHVIPAAEARAFIAGQPEPDAKTLLSLALASL